MHLFKKVSVAPEVWYQAGNTWVHHPGNLCLLPPLILAFHVSFLLPDSEFYLCLLFCVDFCVHLQAPPSPFLLVPAPLAPPQAFFTLPPPLPAVAKSLPTWPVRLLIVPVWVGFLLVSVQFLQLPVAIWEPILPHTSFIQLILQLRVLAAAASTLTIPSPAASITIVLLHLALIILGYYLLAFSSSFSSFYQGSAAFIEIIMSLLLGLRQKLVIAAEIVVAKVKHWDLRFHQGHPNHLVYFSAVAYHTPIAQVSVVLLLVVQDPKFIIFKQSPFPYINSTTAIIILRFRQ